VENNILVDNNVQKDRKKDNEKRKTVTGLDRIIVSALFCFSASYFHALIKIVELWSLHIFVSLINFDKIKTLEGHKTELYYEETKKQNCESIRTGELKLVLPA